MLDFLAGVPGKLKAIYDYLTTNWTTTRADKIDNLDTTISSRAAASTALSTATWTAERADYLDNLTGGIPGTVKRAFIATGTIQSGYGNVYITLSPAVDTSKTIAFIGNHYGSNVITCYISSSTNLTINGPTGYGSVAAVVVEFY